MLPYVVHYLHPHEKKIRLYYSVEGKLLRAELGSQTWTRAAVEGSTFWQIIFLMNDGSP